MNHCSFLLFQGGPFYVSMFLECRCLLYLVERRNVENRISRSYYRGPFKKLSEDQEGHGKPPVKTTLHPSPDTSSALMGLVCSPPHSVPCIVRVCGCVSLSYEPVRLQKAGHVLLLSVRSVHSTWSTAHQLWLLLGYESILCSLPPQLDCRL